MVEKDVILGPKVVYSDRAELINVKEDVPSPSDSLKGKNVVRIGGVPENEVFPPFDEDKFTAHLFQQQSKTQVLTMNDIFSLEKRKDFLKALNLKNTYAQKKAQMPDFMGHTKPSKETKKQQDEIKKTLAIKKLQDGKRQAKMVTTISKKEASKSGKTPKPSARGSRSKTPVKDGAR